MSDLRKEQKSDLQQVGDDKGEGSQRDIPTDRVETSHDQLPAVQASPEEPAGAPEAPAQPKERQQGDRDLGADSKSTIDSQGMK